MSEDRQLYRIKRGSYTRRDGPESKITDSHGNVTGMQRAHVTYSPKTIANSQAKDEVYMSDIEADKFGRQKLERLVAQDIRTIEPRTLKKGEKLQESKAPLPPGVEISNAGGRADEEDDAAATSKMILALIKKGEKAKTPKEKRDFAKEVGNADLIEEVPDKHAEILDALKELA